MNSINYEPGKLLLVKLPIQKRLNPYLNMLSDKRHHRFNDLKGYPLVVTAESGIEGLHYLPSLKVIANKESNGTFSYIIPKGRFAGTQKTALNVEALRILVKPFQFKKEILDDIKNGILFEGMVLMVPVERLVTILTREHLNNPLINGGFMLGTQAKTEFTGNNQLYNRCYQEGVNGKVYFDYSDNGISSTGLYWPHINENNEIDLVLPSKDSLGYFMNQDLSKNKKSSVYGLVDHVLNMSYDMTLKGISKMEIRSKILNSITIK